MKAPATAEGSPVATYASISSSVTCAKRTWVAAERASHTSRWVSMTQCPVWSTPERPRICFQRATASASVPGLPRISPSSASTESQPITSARFWSAATATALSWASFIV